MTAPAVRISRRVAWPDTDAAGIWHHSTLWRWVEEAEAELHRELGLIENTFGHTPRRHLEAEFFAPLKFDDDAEIDFVVDRVGHTSITYSATVHHGGTLVARASMTAVHLVDGRPAPWPDDWRARFEGGLTHPARPGTQ